MKRMWFHRACAHPGHISCIVGVCIANGVMVWLLVHRWGLATLLEPRVLPWSVAAFVPATLSGCLMGLMFALRTSYLCGLLNGAPFKVGEEVVILRGPHAGRRTRVRGFTTGQGGQKLLHLNLGDEIAAKHMDIFEECHVIRAAKNSVSE